MQIYIEYYFGDEQYDLLDNVIKKLKQLFFNLIVEYLEKGMGSNCIKNKDLKG